MVKKFVGVLLTIAVSFSSSATSFAAATQEDVDYSTKVSEIVQIFGADVADWGVALTSAPKLAIGSKFKNYKAKATKSSDKLLLTINDLKSLTPSAGFAKSGPLLVSSMGLYEKAITSLKVAINKNDTKAVTKAGQAAAKASKAFLAWQKAYTIEVAALNG
jgi:hypothetical protein